MLQYYFVFLNLPMQGLKYKPSTQKRTVFTVARSPILQPMMIFADFVFYQFLFLDTGLCQAGSQQLCISKFIFACTCLAFYILSMTQFLQHFACSSLYFLPQSLVFILLILCSHSSHIRFCHVLSYRPNLICNVFELRFLRSYTYLSLLIRS